MKSLGRSFSILLVFLAWSAHGAGFVFTENGQPFRWPEGEAIDYNVDAGDLGSTPQATAAQWVAESFNPWEAVAIGEIAFTDTPGTTASDINAENWLDFVTITEEGVETDETLIIFDEDGGIIGELFPGNEESVLGLALPATKNGSSLEIVTGLAILNGLANDEPIMRRVMTHEFGHMMNLAHSQINTPQALNAIASDDDEVPIMFPQLPETLDQEYPLLPDDQFSLGILYPSNQYSDRGRISGRILRRSGKGVQALNVICRNPEDPEMDVVSWVSDLHFNGKGQYFCGNLNTGDYTVEVEPLLFAVNAFDPDPPFIPTEFYNGDSESFDPEIDDRNDAENLPVTEGERIDDIDIVLNDDGRLVSGKSVSGSIEGSFPDFEYVISVPKSADTVTFEVKTESDADIDILGRCDTEFSLTFLFDPSVPPLTGPENEQAEFSTSDNPSGNEKVTLDKDSNPEIHGCEYHILLVNFSSDETPEFEITATIEGAEPELRIDKGSGKTTSEGSGEIVVANPTFTAVDDTFRVEKITFTDGGNGNLANVIAASFYEDLDESGDISAEDRLVDTTEEIDIASRKFTFSAVDEFFEPEAMRSFLVSYTVEGKSAQIPLLLALAFLGFLFRRPSWGCKVVIGIAFLLSLSCGKTSGYSPSIQSNDDIEVSGQTFGSNFKLSVQGSNPASVKDFFD